MEWNDGWKMSGSPVWIWATTISYNAKISKALGRYSEPVRENEIFVRDREVTRCTSWTGSNKGFAQLDVGSFVDPTNRYSGPVGPFSGVTMLRNRFRLV